MMKKLPVVVACILLLVSCGPAQTVTVPVTVLADRPITVQVPVTVEVPVQVPVTVLVQPTARPTAVPTVVPTPAAEQAIAANFVVSQTQSGVSINLLRVLCGSYDALAKKVGLADDSDFDGMETVCEFILEVRNSTDKNILIYPDQGQVVIGDEQVEPLDFHGGLQNLEDISGEFLPGVRRIGGFWFGLRRISWDTITKITYTVGSAFDKGFQDLGEDFYFEIGTTGWKFEPIPDKWP
jgi:hypothetical protein